MGVTLTRAVFGTSSGQSSGKSSKPYVACPLKPKLQYPALSHELSAVGGAVCSSHHTGPLSSDTVHRRGYRRTHVTAPRSICPGLGCRCWLLRSA